MICVEAAQEMRAGPSEPAFRSGLQTTPSRCGQEPSVVSAGVKASGTYPEQARIRETNESEPSMTHRYLSNCRQHQGRLQLLGPLPRSPARCRPPRSPTPQPGAHGAGMAVQRRSRQSAPARYRLRRPNPSVRYRCVRQHLDLPAALSCQGRGVCPSCNAVAAGPIMLPNGTSRLTPSGIATGKATCMNPLSERSSREGKRDG